jgi:hypothetical protein
MPWYWKVVPRKSRVDAPGALQHIIARGIDRGKIFQDPADKRNFLNRMAKILIATETRYYAWALIPNIAGEFNFTELMPPNSQVV